MPRLKFSISKLKGLRQGGVTPIAPVLQLRQRSPILTKTFYHGIAFILLLIYIDRLGQYSVTCLIRSPIYVTFHGKTGLVRTW